MKHIKKYVLPVLCIVAGLLLVLGCEDTTDNGGGNNNGDSADTTAPSIIGPSVATQNTTSATVNVTVDEAATLLWVLYSGTDPGHTTASAVVTASGDTDAGVQRKNNDTAVANTQKSISLSGLTAGTYYFYLVARDEADNDTLADKLTITISADTVMLQINDITVNVGGNCLLVYGSRTSCAQQIDSGHVISTLSTTYDGSGTVSYSVSDTTNFAISSSGVLSFAVANPTIGSNGIEVTVTATDGTVTDTATVTVTNSGTFATVGDGSYVPNGSTVTAVPSDGADGEGALQLTTVDGGEVCFLTQ